MRCCSPGSFGAGSWKAAAGVESVQIQRTMKRGSPSYQVPIPDPGPHGGFLIVEGCDAQWRIIPDPRREKHARTVASAASPPELGPLAYFHWLILDVDGGAHQAEIKLASIGRGVPYWPGENEKQFRTVQNNGMEPTQCSGDSYLRAWYQRRDKARRPREPL